MARKQFQSTAESNGSAPSKTEAVKECLAAGITSPTEIARHLKVEFGLDITPAHVSTIKGNLKRAAREEPEGEFQEQAVFEPSAAPPEPVEGGLTPKDLAALVDMAKRAGGFDTLQEFVEVLKG